MIFLTVGFLTLTGGQAAAQTDQDAVARNVIKTDRQTVVTESLQLNINFDQIRVTEMIAIR